VVGGESQWEEALNRLVGRDLDTGYDEEQGIPAGVPVGQAAQALRFKFGRFVQRLRPPEGQQTYRALVQWLEG